jgi:SAM-dependent methyltransferase
VTDVPELGRGAALDFMSPLSAARADRVVRDLAAARPASVLDLGCGWGELLLRLLAALPEANGTGIDTDGPDIVRARAAAVARGLDGRVAFVEGPAAEYAEPADLVLSIGAYQAFGTVPEAFAALRSRVNPGGRLLCGVEFWERVPSAERLARMWPGITAGDCMELGDLVDAATHAGYRPLDVATATTGEWEEFESGLAADTELWLLAHPTHPEADAMRAKLDAQRSIWLRGHRGHLGFAYLTLGVPVA